MEKFVAALEEQGFKKEKEGVFAKLKFQYFFKDEGGERICIAIAGKQWYKSKQKSDGHIVSVANGTI